MDFSDIVPLYDYQKRWVCDTARFKIGLWSRQTGKSFSTSLEAVLDCLARKTDWVFLSSGERQSKELIRKAKMHGQALNLLCDEVEFEQRGRDGTVYKALEINFRNGSRIMALPANPDTARGHSANVVLDEFAFHQDSRKIWQSLFPTITRGYKIRIISTPQGRKNKFYELWTGNPLYSKHTVNIYDAVDSGLPIFGATGEPCGPEDLKVALDDDEAWEQEYLVQFVDESTAFISYELISQVEIASIDEDSNQHHGGSVYAGLDIGRKRDVTVYWAFEEIGDVLWSMKKVELQGQKFSDQLARLVAEISADNPVRVCVDSTGIGLKFCEDLQSIFGESVIEAVHFNSKTKEQMAVDTKARFEDQRIRIPIARRVRDDIHKIKKSTTIAGNIRFQADNTTDGHSDRFWALALACHAALNPAAMPLIKVGPARIPFYNTKAYYGNLNLGAY